jgi:phage terminase small subunit
MARMTDAQKRFADEYLIDLNATRAYRAAYPSVSKDSTASAAGARMLRNVKVEAYINKRQNDIQNKTSITQERVIKELATIAFLDTTELVKVKGRRVMLTNTEDLTEGQRRAIASIKKGKNGVELSTYDKIKALELIGRHLGMFKDKVEVSGSVDAGLEKLTSILNQVKKDE